MDNKKILSTIVLIILLAVLCFACWFDIFMSVAVTDAAANPNPPNSTGDGTGDLIAAGLSVLVIGGGFVWVLAASVLTVLISLICLVFSIRNTKVESNPVKAINIILSCLFSAGAALGLIAIILLRVL